MEKKVNEWSVFAIWFSKTKKNCNTRKLQLYYFNDDNLMNDISTGLSLQIIASTKTYQCPLDKSYSETAPGKI